MNPENAIEVRDLEKSFRVYYDKGNSLKEKVVYRNRNKHEDRKVLKGISFDVKKGEAIGLIGHNGCGKSTTLKLLSHIIYPDSGTIEISGRVSSLIELGAGFHPDMSGRENIYTNAAIFGLGKKEIDSRIDDIINFSELEEFIDNPVRTYSSGMYMRLAFSVAINVNADVLLIDEILAVGDANFQTKCFDKLREIKASGVTIVLVTHDNGAVERLCDQALWLNDGEVMGRGKARDVVDQYMNYMNEEKAKLIKKEEERRKAKEEEELRKTKEQTKADKEKEEADRKEQELYAQAMDYSAKHFGTKDAIIKSLVVRDHEGKESQVLYSGKPYTFEYNYEIKNHLEEFIFGMGFYTLEGAWIFGTNTQINGLHLPCEEDEGKVVFQGEDLPLLGGKYLLQVSITDLNGRPVDFYREYCKIDVISSYRDSGMVYMKHSWKV